LLNEAQGDGPKTIRQFTEQLLKMLHRLMSAQAKHVKVNTKMMNQCLNEDKFRKKEVANAKHALHASGSALSKCQASLHAAQENLPALQKALQDYQDELKKKTEERRKAHLEYLQRKRDWTDAIRFLQEFTRIVDKKLKNYGHSFAELSEQLLKHVSKLGRISDAVPVLAALAAAPKEGHIDIPHNHNNYKYQAQTGTVKSLKDHLKDLINRLKADSHENDVREAKAVKIFRALKAKLEAIIGELSKDISRTKKQIRDMKKCIVDEKAVMVSASNKIRRNTKLLKSAKHTCADFARAFVKATKNRLEEIKTVNQVIVIVKRRFKQLPHDLVKYLEEVKDHFKKYINSTQFKKYVAYVQKHTKDNKHGRVLTTKNLLKKF
jgi:predicted  nucleic acid-binding Zn-ribbon protein